MRGFFRCLSAEFIKTKCLPIRIAHIVIPISIAVIFLAYYAYAPWDAYSKVEAYFQVLGMGFPFLIGLFSVMVSEQELTAGAFQGMLAIPQRRMVFLAKLFLLVLFGACSVLAAGVLFGTGYFYLLKQQLIAYSFYWKGAAILLGSSIFLYIWHLFLAFRFNKGVSIGMGMVEGLLSALLLTGLGEAVWIYVPCAWASRLVSIALANSSGREISQTEYHSAVLLCIICTFIALAAYFVWCCRWEGEKTND